MTTPNIKQEPFIWLQQSEAAGQADCGCLLESSGPEDQDGAAVYLCPLHTAAQGMSEALEEARAYIESLLDLKPDAAIDALTNNAEAVETRLAAALAQALPGKGAAAAPGA